MIALNLPARSTLSALLVSILCLGLGVCKEKPEQQAVRQAWEAYSTAMESMDGPTVAKHSSDSTLKYYERLLKTGLTAPAQQVWGLPPVEMREVLMMRNRATRSQLRGYTGKGYLIYATNQGWGLGGGDDTEWKFTEIKVTGDKATAKMVEVIPMSVRNLAVLSRRARVREAARRERQRQARSYTLSFVLEESVWKFDETTLHPRFNNELSLAAKQFRVPMREILMDLESDESGKDGTMKTWDPMK